MIRSVLTVALAVAVLAAGAPRVGAQSPPMTTTTPATTAPPAPPLERAVGRVLTLDDAVALALEAQPNILARLNDYAASRFRVDQAFAPLLPQLSGQWTTTKSQTSQLTTLTGTGGQSVAVTVSRDFGDTMLAQVVLSQLIFDFGKNLASTDAARKTALVALEDVELQRQLITQEVKVQYTNINFAQRLIRVQQQAVERAELNLRSARGFFEVGTRPRSDVTRAEVDVANARVDVIRAQNAERLARVALNAAIGLPSDTPLQIQDNLVYEKVVIDSTRLLEQALRQRPEYRQARLRTEAADALVRRSFRDFFPDISGSGAYGAARSSFDETWAVGVTLNWSIFDGGNRIARYREARANLDASQARVKASELDISREVEQARSTVVETEERILAAQKAVESAQENFRLAQGRFDAGVGTILELTDAQLALTQAQNTEAQALADFRVALARLDRALGRR
jgi:outer membrane protein TolC